MKLMKVVNTKSVVLINCRKIKHQPKNTFMCKQLNGPLLKSLKTNRVEIGEKWPGLARAETLHFVPGRARAKISLSGRAGPGPSKSGPCRPLVLILLFNGTGCCSFSPDDVCYVWSVTIVKFLALFICKTFINQAKISGSNVTRSPDIIPVSEILKTTSKFHLRNEPVKTEYFILNYPKCYGHLAGYF